MTDEQILELAKKYLEEGEHCDDGYCSSDWIADTEDLLKFARCLLDYGFSEGHKDGYAEGVNDEQMYPENAWSDL